MDWQSWAVCGVVALTTVLMLRGVVRRRRPGCGSDCDCAANKGRRRGR